VRVHQGFGDDILQLHICEPDGDSEQHGKRMAAGEPLIPETADSKSIA